MRKNVILIFISAIIFSSCPDSSSTGVYKDNTYPTGPEGTITVSGLNPKPITTLYGENYWC